jgi:hypothetical protein
MELLSLIALADHAGTNIVLKSNSGLRYMEVSAKEMKGLLDPLVAVVM